MPLQETSGAASYDAFGGGVAERVFIEEVFSTWLYTGNGSTQTITNGIDLSTKGGLVWVKGRSAASSNILTDTVRGAGTSDVNNNALSSNESFAEDLGSSYDYVSAFSSTGFSVAQGGTTTGTRGTNYTSVTYASWTFRKQPKFFDVVTYTGTGSARTVAHNLGSVPGCIIVKRLDTGENWQVYHRTQGNTKYLLLNSSVAAATSSTRWNNTTPTSTLFTVGTAIEVNESGGTYIAYLFAHDAGGFGLSGTDNVISCGSWTGTGTSPGPTITLGWEPQFILYKRASGGTGDWGIHDNMRGLGVGTSSTSGSGNRLEPNTSDAETGPSNFANISATGFTITPTVADVNASGSTYIYIAIRRGPMKVPTSGTQIANPKGLVTLTSGQTVTTGFVTDMTMAKFNGTQEWLLSDRLRNTVLYPNTTDSEGALYGTAGPRPFDVQDGFKTSGIGGSYALWGFRRAPGFMDVVCYTGTGSARTVDHNLAAVPEFIIVKQRATGGTNWRCYHSANLATNGIALNLDLESFPSISYWNDTAPTSSVFSVGTSTQVNASGGTYIAYLFATVAGVSKVGSYTGSGTTKQIDCGFTGGARFVLIKRTDSTGNWHLYDSGQGIVAGNDPYFLVNTSDGQYVGSDYVDTYSAGFELSSTAPAGLNANGGTYIFLAIA